jgi:alpha-L-fucosidase 2
MTDKSNQHPTITVVLAFILSLQFLFTVSSSLGAQDEQKPLKLWFDSPAPIWEEALPLGNGRTGAMVFGGVEKEHFSLNDHHLWSGGPDAGNEGSPELLDQIRKAVFEGRYDEADQLWKGMHGPYTARYLPMGDLFLEFPLHPGSPKNYERNLDLRNALSTVTYEQEGIIYKRESFISYPDQVMVVRLSASEPGKITFNARLTSQLYYTVEAEAPDQLILKGKAPAHVAHRDNDPKRPGCL